ncbi:hypothetical protein V8E54_003860 [Elaphomyces granulatus]
MGRSSRYLNASRSLCGKSLSLKFCQVKRHKNGKPGKSVRRFYRSPPHRRILVRSHQKKIIGALALLLLIYILTYQPPTLHPSYRRIEDVPGYESSGIEEIFKKSDRVNNERNAVDCAEI